MNKGIDLAKGEWLYFLGTDDKLCGNNTLEKVFNKKINNTTKIVFGNIEYNFKNKQSEIFNSSWSFKFWLKNTLHHQSAFYRKDLFTTQKFSKDYKILADYALNLSFFCKKVKVEKVNQTISICNPYGISKNKNWPHYKEEIKLKTDVSSKLLQPVFFIIAFLKFITK